MVVLLTRFIWYWLGPLNPMKVVCFSQGTVATFYSCSGLNL